MMSTGHTQRIALFPAFFTIAVVAVVFLGCTDNCGDGCGDNQETVKLSGDPVKVGVLLPKSGLAELGYEEPLEWVVENVNNSGGIDGRPLKLVWKDIGASDVQTEAETLLEDDTIVAVIGTDSSSDTFDLAPKFIEHEKVLVTPAATSAMIFKAFAGQKYIWRTLESDVAQLRTMFIVAAEENIKSVGLITSTDTYGATFFDWFGFFATEMDMKVAGLEQYDQENKSCNSYMDNLFECDPEMIFAVPSDPATAICIVEKYHAYKENGGTAKLLFSDGGTYSSVVTETSGKAVGLRGLGMGFDPMNGFHYAYKKKFGYPPSAYAANCYDALAIVAYGLKRSGGQGGEVLAQAMMEIVDARGEPTEWDEEGFIKAFELIEEGNLPDISGATGPLEYDAEDHTDLVRSIFALWEIVGEEFEAQDYLWSNDGKSAGAQSAHAIFKSIASDEKMQDLSGGSGSVLPEKTGTWALIVATSSGWNNYRHQADALADYQLLRSHQVTDEKIVLIMADDISNHPENKLPGIVRNEKEGPNLYENVTIDYFLEDITSDDLMDILIGKFSDHLPEVIESTASDNLYIFLVGHGTRSGVLFGDEDHLDPVKFAETLVSMQAEGRYRQVLVKVEACHGGVMGEELAKEEWELSDVVLLSGANGYENSLGSEYDPETGAWTADRFAHKFVSYARENQDSSLMELYDHLYHTVNGSHTSVYNHERIENLDNILIEEFITP